MVFKKKQLFFLKDGLQKLVQRWQKCVEVLAILWKKNYTALKITDVDIFLFYFIKISFPVYFVFKWRQNLSSRPRTLATSERLKKK